MSKKTSQSFFKNNQRRSFRNLKVMKSLLRLT